jgi:hypothetical protein
LGRLPGSNRDIMVLAHDPSNGTLLLRAGGWAMRVVPRRASWPDGLAAGKSLDAVMAAGEA